MVRSMKVVIASILCLFFYTKISCAAYAIVSEGTNILGVTGIEINGNTYDVTFYSSGTVEDIYGTDTDGNYVFCFTSYNEATNAHNVLETIILNSGILSEQIFYKTIGTDEEELSSETFARHIAPLHTISNLFTTLKL
nr:hypothetical protein [uncultured Desulfobacter sp.]